MSKYFDKLVKMNESLDKELRKMGLVAEDGNNDDEITIPKDSLTDDQKKDILVDKGVDQNTVDAMKDSDEIASALDATLNNDNVEQKNESADEAVILRMDDNDLELHGYIKMNIDNKVRFVDDEAEADVFDTREEAEIVKKEICDMCSFDPDTITFQNAYSQVDGDGEEWMALDPAHPGATTTK